MARQVPLAAAGPGWQLAQTLADSDEGAWQVIAPGGTRAGTVRRSHPGARSWTATRGDPADRHDTLLALYPGADPGRGGRRLAHPGSRGPRRRLR
jgi:hypothetical protein